MNDYFCAEH